MKSFKTTKLPQIVVITEYFGENNNKILLSVAFEGFKRDSTPIIVTRICHYISITLPSGRDEQRCRQFFHITAVSWLRHCILMTP